MSKLADILRQEWRLQKQRREIEELRAQVAKLEAQNERMQAGMRRCLSCDYRLEVLASRQPAEPSQGTGA